MAFFVYSSDSIILFIIVTMFHKLYIFFLNVVGCLFYVKHGFFCYGFLRSEDMYTVKWLYVSNQCVLKGYTETSSGDLLLTLNP